MRLTWAAAALILSGCGYIGEPMYPLLDIPERVNNLAGVQRGSVIIYQFTLPKLTTEGKAAKVGRIEMRIGESGQGPFNQGEWLASATPIEIAPSESDDIRGEIPTTPWIGKDIVMAVRVFGVNRRDVGWSNLVAVTVVAPVPKPAGVGATAIVEGVRVDWRGPAGRYRVFRRLDTDREFSLVATVEAGQWNDTAAEYGKTYLYLVQAIRKAGDSEAESELSETVSVTPADTFPPAVPSGLNAIAGADNVELVWERSTEQDLAAYRLYRALDGGALEKIADVPDAPSYSDRGLESGRRYRYAVSAVDRLGNESKQSQAVEVTAP